MLKAFSEECSRALHKAVPPLVLLALSSGLGWRRGRRGERSPGHPPAISSPLDADTPFGLRPPSPALLLLIGRRGHSLDFVGGIGKVPSAAAGGCGQTIVDFEYPAHQIVDEVAVCATACPSRIPSRCSCPAVSC